MIPIACQNCGHVGQYSLNPIASESTSEPVKTSEPVNTPVLVPSHKPDQLTAREKEVVRLIVVGFKNKEIASKLYISEQTVKNHLNHIFDKTGVKDRLELALWQISREQSK